MDQILKTEEKNSYRSNRVRIIPPYPFTHHFRVNSDEAGLSLIGLLEKRFPFRSREQWEQRIVSGNIRIQDHIVSPYALLKENDRISHFNPAVKEPSVPDGVRIIDQTDAYLIAFKPAPMPIHPGGRYFKNTLTSILREMGHSDLKVIHRLDAVTSGLILLGRQPDFTRAATEAFRTGQVQKKYFAIVKGIPEEKTKTIDLPIRRKTGFIFEFTEKSENLKPAVTRFELIRSFEDRSLVACYPVTGRTHQIRLHLKAWGHPVIDDYVYHIDDHSDPSIRQRHAIHLFNAGLFIPKLNVNYELQVPAEWQLNPLS